MSSSLWLIVTDKKTGAHVMLNTAEFLSRAASFMSRCLSVCSSLDGNQHYHLSRSSINECPLSSRTCFKHKGTSIMKLEFLCLLYAWHSYLCYMERYFCFSSSLAIRETQIKTTKRYYLHIQLAKIKKSVNIEYWRGHGSTASLTLHW